MVYNVVVALNYKGVTIIVSEDKTRLAEKIGSCMKSGAKTKQLRSSNTDFDVQQSMIYGDQNDIRNVRRTLNILIGKSNRRYFLPLCSLECINNIFQLTRSIGLASRENAWLVFNEHTILDTKNVPDNVMYLSLPTAHGSSALQQFYRIGDCHYLSKICADHHLNTYTAR